jgi:DNA replication protein DnaC
LSLEQARLRWGEIFGDEIVAAALIDRHVPSRVVPLKGDSHRLKDRDLGGAGADSA